MNFSFPCGTDLKAVIEGFSSNWRLCQCVGPIDGRHIPVVVRMI